MTTSTAGYEKVTISPGPSRRRESHTGTLEGQTPVGVNGEGRHGLITPLSYEPIFPHEEPGSSPSGGVYHPTTLTGRDAMVRKPQGTSWADGESTCSRGSEERAMRSETYPCATTPCVVALSPLSAQISARGVVTAVLGKQECLVAFAERPAHGRTPTPERNELVKRRAAGRKKYLPRCFSSLSCERHC